MGRQAGSQSRVDTALDVNVLGRWWKIPQAASVAGEAAPSTCLTLKSPVLDRLDAQIIIWDRVLGK